MAALQRAEPQPEVETAVVCWLEQGHIGIGLNHGLFEHWRVPFLPCGRVAFRLLLVLGQEVQVVVIGGRIVGAPGLGKASGVLNRYPLPALRERAGKTGREVAVWFGLAAEVGDVLLAEQRYASARASSAAILAWLASQRRICVTARVKRSQFTFSTASNCVRLRLDRLRP